MRVERDRMVPAPFFGLITLVFSRRVVTEAEEDFVLGLALGTPDIVDEEHRGNIEFSHQFCSAFPQLCLFCKNKAETEEYLEMRSVNGRFLTLSYSVKGFLTVMKESLARRKSEPRPGILCCQRLWAGIRRPGFCWLCPFKTSGKPLISPSFLFLVYESIDRMGRILN